VPHVLHLVKDPANSAALEVIRAQAADPGMRVSVVLMQDAARMTDALPGQVYRLEDGHTALPAQTGSTAIGPAELLDLVFAADSVVTW
jgi:hypothetical protein